VDAEPASAETARWIDGQDGLQCCGSAKSAEEALAEIARLKPDLVIVDIALPRRHGLDLIKDVRALSPAVAVLVHSGQDEMLYAERALRAGARGYVAKHDGEEALHAAIRRVLGGEVSVSPRVTAKVLRHFSGVPVPVAASHVEKLTDREFEVYRLIGTGRSSKEIAGELNLSNKTVAVHRGSIRKKLGLVDAAKLVRHATQWATEREA